MCILGKNAILTLSFGALICFIFDLLGAIEATLLSVFLTLAILWVNLIYTSRFILKESILNISYSALFGTILFSAFLLISSYFHLFQIHFEFLCLKIHFFLLISLPALAAPILSWFLVHQFPDLDLSLCFSFIYFIYAFILHSNTSIRISSSQYLFIYTFPLLISPILYLSLHHNVLSSVRNHLLSLSTAFFFPLLIALYSFNVSHLNSFSSSTRSQVKAFIPALKLIASVLLLISLQNHNFFTDLKIYSGYKEPFASLLLLSSFFFTSLAFHIDQHYVQSYILQLKEDITLDSNSRVARHLFVADIAENIAIIIASLAFGLLLRLPPSIFIFCILCVRINFFFSRSSFKNRRLARYLFTLGAASTAVSIVLSFSEDTLRTIQINFEGLFYSFGMNTFTRCSAGLVGLSVLLPSLMTIEPSPSPSSVPLGDLAPSSTVNSLRSSYFYDAILILFVAFASAMEVVVREQVPQIDSVFPVYPTQNILFVLLSCPFFRTGRIAPKWTSRRCILPTFYSPRPFFPF